MKYFLFDVDSQLGSALFAELKVAGDFFYGTLANKGFRVSPFVKAVDTWNSPLVIRTALGCDVSFAKISDSNEALLLALLAAADDRRLDNDHLLVLVDNENSRPEFFTTRNSRLRILRVNVGLVYGHGEEALFELFADAWQGRAPVGSEENEISMIHAIDLVRGIKRLLAETSEAPDTPVPQIREISLADMSRGRISRAAIAAAAAEHMAAVKPLPKAPAPAEAKPADGEPAAGETEAVDEARETAAEAEVEAKPEPEEEPEMPADSHCMEGPVNGVHKLVQEFVRQRGLRPLRVAVLGSDDGTVSGQLAQHYGLPSFDGRSLGSGEKIKMEIARHNACSYRGYLVNLNVSAAVVEELLKSEEGEEPVLAVDVVVGLGELSEIPKVVTQKWDVPIFGINEEHVLEKLIMFVGKSPNFLGRSSHDFWTPLQPSVSEQAEPEDETVEEFVNDSRRLEKVEEVRAHRQILENLDLRSYLMDVCIPGVSKALDTLRRAGTVADEDAIALVADALNLP